MSASSDNDGVPVVIDESLVIYGTLEGCTEYFESQFRKGLWNDTDPTDQEKALTTATQSIDMLRFKGEKTDPDQLLQFPRDAATEVPEAIIKATYELAYCLLDGIDIEAEIRDQRTQSNTLGMVKSINHGFSQQHILAGIPSYRAWCYLIPFLRQAGEIQIRRVD